HHSLHSFPNTTLFRSLRGFSYTAKMSSIRRMYSSSSSATHHIFFPPRLQVVAFQQDPNRFSPHPRNQFALHHFFGKKCGAWRNRSEEHTSELQSRFDL